MRIGVVTTSYPRRPGDPAGTFVAGFARWLAAAGHEVEVVAAGPGDATDGSVRIVRVNAGAGLFYDEGAPERLERSLVARARAPLFAGALGLAVARHSGAWDAVVSHWLLPCGATVALAARGRPHLAVAHSGDVDLALRLGVARPLMASLLAGGRTRVVFAGEHLRDRMLAALGPRLGESMKAASLVSPMGIDAARFALARGQREASRSRLGLASPVVAFLGRLVPIKGVRVLVDAVARLPGVVLAVAGDGPERTSLEELARRRGVAARFFGELRGNDRDAILAAADVIVVPSVDLPDGRTEGTPTVVLEALAAGVALVASDVGGIRRLAGEAAWLVPPGEPAALAEAIGAALGDDGREARIAAGRRIAAEHDWQRVGPRLLAALEPTLR